MTHKTAATTTFWGEAYVFALRAAVIAIVAAIVAITVSYSANIYYDREAVLTDAFQCVNRALEESATSHWLVNGSLLGAVRLQHFVMWDSEVDVAMLLDKISSALPAIEKVQAMCAGFGDAVRVSVAPGDNATSDVNNLASWRLCSSRVCVVIYEYMQAGEQLLSQFGMQAASTALPVTSCIISGVLTQCPRDDNYFLSQSFGGAWRTDRLTHLFA